MKVNYVLKKARYTLSDPDTDHSRWSNDRLLSLLNDALLDLALTTHLYNSVAFIRMQQNVSFYDVSDFVLRLQRVEHLDLPLSFSSFDEMDALGDWQSDKSDKPKKIVYDLKYAGEFRVYPIPTLGTTDFLDDSQHYGIITSINYEDTSFQPIMTGTTGEVSIPDIENCLKLFYVSKPQRIKYIDQYLDKVIDETVVSAIVNYICGHAFRDSLDVQNRAMGNEELQLYEVNKSYQVQNKMTNFVKRTRFTKYRGMG